MSNINKEQIEAEEKKLNLLYDKIAEQKEIINNLKLKEVKEKLLGKYVRVVGSVDDYPDSKIEAEYMFVTNIWCNANEVYVEGYSFSYEFYEYRDCSGFYWNPFRQLKYNLYNFLEDDKLKNFIIVDKDAFMDAFFYATNQMIDETNETDYEKHVDYN